MARLTLVLQDRRDVLREGDRCRARFVGVGGRCDAEKSAEQNVLKIGNRRVQVGNVRTVIGALLRSARPPPPMGESDRPATG